MKKIPIVLAAIFVAVVLIVPAFSATRVVHAPNTSPCTTGDYYYNAAEYCCYDYYGHGEKAYGPIQQAAIDAAGAETDSIIVCPGTYTDNVKLAKHIASYSQKPEDTIVQAKHSNIPVFYNVRYLSGFTIKGATADGTTCLDEDGDGHQPCAGYRTYCPSNPSFIRNNIFENNYIGVHIKDTAPDWPFFFTIEGNKIENNIKGIQLYNGHDTTIRSNDIYNNTTGVYVLNTTNNTITGNNIYDNANGIEVRARDYWNCGPGGNAYCGDYHVKYNRIFHNVILDPVSYLDENTGSTCPKNDDLYFYHPYFKQGNYWGSQSYSPDCYDPYPLSFAYHLEDDFQDGVDDGWVKNSQVAQFWSTEEDPVSTNNFIYSMKPLPCEDTWEYPIFSTRGEVIATDNVVIKAKAKDVGDNCSVNFRIVFAYDQTTNDVYWAGANLRGGIWVIQKNFENLATPLTDAALKDYQGEPVQSWFNLEVVIENNTVKLKANGVEKLSAPLPVAARNNLKAGVGGILNHAHFDDFEVIQY